MNSDFGKALFSSYEEALRVSNSLVKKHKRGFNVYKIGSNWAIGGVHTKKIHKVKSFNELKEIYDSLAMIDSNDLVDDYFKDIALLTTNIKKLQNSDLIEFNVIIYSKSFSKKKLYYMN